MRNPREKTDTMPGFAKARKKIADLVKRFKQNPPTSEAATRLEFIDPFFEALGWDVRNVAGHAEQYKDVVVEPSVMVGAATKAPDYSVRIGGVRKFFVEAKKPSVPIKSDTHPAYQLRRYAWSAKLPLSVLTDFEEFAVYDCTKRPKPTDKASKARIFYWTFDEYPKTFREIWDIFAKESILKGSFDRYAEKARGTAEVDAEFLKEIEGWRTVLARNIALRNRKLDIDGLNEAVQRIIDRIVFLRMAEDRGIEPQGKLLGLVNAPRIYERFGKLCEAADAKYNSGLFDFKADTWTLGLKVDDKVLKPIIEGVYYPKSPYEFSVIPPEILGNVYEQFLGKVIRLTSGHQARIEEKPEVRKAGGVYYTPKYIVDYIVEHTVGELIKQARPDHKDTKAQRGSKERTARTKHRPPNAPLPKHFHVLDPACGSGSFLLGAYQRLLDHYLEWYVAHNPEKRKKQVYRVRGTGVSPVNGRDVGADRRVRPTKGRHTGLPLQPNVEWRLTTAERKRILTEHIYGVDIDRQAVEVTKLSLLLKVLEGESADSLGRQMQLFRERALPNLKDNIKCGNSLIGPDYFEGRLPGAVDADELRRVNPFDWEAEFPHILGPNVPRKRRGFDAAIGNPPYDVLEKDRGASSWPHTSLREYVNDRLDYLPALGGKLNLFRFFIVQGLNLTRVNARLSMIVPLALLGDKSCAAVRKHLIASCDDFSADCFPQKDNAKRRVFAGAKLSTTIFAGTKKENKAERNAAVSLRVFPWNSFHDACRAASIKLSDAALLDPANVPVPLVDEHQWNVCMKLHRHRHVSQLGEVPSISVTRGEINQTIYRRFITSNPKHARLLKGVEVGRYSLRSRLSQGTREWFDEVKYLREHDVRETTGLERIATQRITGVDERLRIVATLIDGPAYFAGSTNSVHVAPTSPYGQKFVLGLLNSRLFQWRFKLTSTNNNVATNELQALPFRCLDFAVADDRAAHDRVVELVDQMLALHKQRHAAKKERDKELIQRQIDATDRKIDRLVYKLYGLTEKEIRIVEEGTK